MKPNPSILRVFVLLAALLVPSLSSAAPFTFKRGVNISHWLSQNSAARPYAAPWFDEEDVTWIAAQGFDHIRLAVDIRSCLAADGTLDEAKLLPVVKAIQWSRAHGLGLVLDAHFLPGADFNSTGGDKRVYTDAALQEKVAGVWRSLAKRFASEGDYLRFEILNEPVADENAQLNPFMHKMLAAIRESNPTRLVYVTSNKWSQFATVPDVVLPDDAHIALTVHNYMPMIFTHQRAAWTGLPDTMPAVRFPGVVPDLGAELRAKHPEFGQPGTPLTVAQMAKPFDDVAAWVQAHRPGMEVYLGEFGVFRTADPASQRHWIAAMVAECDKRGWTWAVWDYQGGFAVRAPDGSGTAILQGLFHGPGDN